MNLNDVKPLQPLSYGNILIVGAKSSNFDDEIRTHPRIILWDNQQKHWTDKDLPSNVRAVFVTRFVGHSEFSKIHAECRKRQLTMFNPEGTGMIAKQVKELLAMPTLSQFLGKETMTQTVETTKKPQFGKLKALILFIDHAKSHTANARFLMGKAGELGIQTTQISLAQFVGTYVRKLKKPVHVTNKRITEVKKLDVSVEILDNMIKELTDMREFLLATVKENRELKMRVETLKKVLG